MESFTIKQWMESEDFKSELKQRTPKNIYSPSIVAFDKTGEIVHWLNGRTTDAEDAQKAVQALINSDTAVHAVVVVDSLNRDNDYNLVYGCERAEDGSIFVAVNQCFSKTDGALIPNRVEEVPLGEHKAIFDIKFVDETDESDYEADGWELLNAMGTPHGDIEVGSTLTEAFQTIENLRKTDTTYYQSGNKFSDIRGWCVELHVNVGDGKHFYAADSFLTYPAVAAAANQ